MSKKPSGKSRLLTSFNDDQSEIIGDAIVAKGYHEGDSGGRVVTFRGSEPLLRALDERAQTEHRNRGSLIRHALWTYLHNLEGGAPKDLTENVPREAIVEIAARK